MSSIAIRYRSSFPAFLDFAFRELHPGKALVKAPYLDLLADRMGEVARGSRNRFIVNQPPRTLKSVTMLALIAFILGRDPSTQIMFIAGNQRLAKELMEKLIRLMSSRRYRGLFSQLNFKVSGSRISTSVGGFVNSSIVGQPLGGRGADYIFIDDPLSPSFASNSRVRQDVNNWFDSVVPSRPINHVLSTIVLFMQRVHPEDLTSHLLGKNQRFEQLSLAAIACWDEEWELGDGRILGRKKGQLLNPNKDSIAQLVAKVHEIGAFNFNSQYLQGAFAPWIENEFKSGFFWEQPALPWTVDTKIPGGGLYSIPYVHIIEHEIFGSKRGYPDLIDSLDMPLDLWEQQTIRHQEALVRDVQEEMVRYFSAFEKPPS